MKRSTLFAVPLVIALCLTGPVIFAQHGAGGGHGFGGGPSIGEGHGRGPNPNSQGTNGESSRELGKTPSQLLTQNTKLSAKLAGLLPPGTDLQQAAQGFKNLGQFVAAVHVSHNLDIPFSDLKTKMMSGDSLGKAIHALKPDVSAKAEAKKAKKQADETINETNS